MNHRTKTTNPGWPDPTDWINRLYATMAARQADYEAEADILLKRNKAAGMLGQVVLALHELPAFRDDTVHLPLKDLLIFLSDLDRGRDHPWSAPVNFGGTNRTTTAQSELKAWVRAAYRILIANGFKPVEAYRRIAKGLTVSGRTGRGNAAVRWQTVQTWCLEQDQPSNARITEKVERWWNDFREHFRNGAADPPDGSTYSEKALAGKFADSCWSLAHLRDRSISGASE